MEEWLEFFTAFFDDENDALKFVEECEGQSPPDNVAKVLMHQTKRLVSLADDIAKIRPHEETLQLLILMMCTENIAKLHDGFKGEGKSRAYVKRFFRDFLSQADKQILGDGFMDNEDFLLRPIGFDRAVDLLYNLRCDVVHEGNYSDFSFHDGRMSIVNTDPNVTANLRLEDFRGIIARGCIKATKDKL